MQLPNHRPGNLDTLSQYANETNHWSENSEHYPSMYSDGQAIPACTVKSELYNKAAKTQNSRQADTAI